MPSESMLEQLRDALAAHTGLGFDGRGWHDFERRIAAAARDAGARDTEDYVRRILATPPDRRQVEILARHLTVGETYFFREKHSFEALAHHVLPERLRERERGERQLRIWSAGCCTGEEAYSMAILLDRLLADRPDGGAGWDIRVLATDINPDFLETARKGVYGEWSFRGTPAWVKNGYFRRRRDGSHEVLPKIRERVDFSFLNLADGTSPPHPEGMDIILCRNVLMYFTPAKARGVVARFQRALREDGLLLVSPAETSATLFSAFSPVNFPGAIFYSPCRLARSPRTASAPASRAAGSRQTAALEIPRNVTPRAAPRRRTAVPPAPAGQQAHGRDDAAAFSRSARHCANEGRLDEAAEWCAKAVAANKLDPAVHYLAANIDQERGRIADAAQALQRALFLDPDFALAHFALGNLRLSEGRLADAARHFENLRSLLKNVARDDVLPEAGGLTAGRLDEIAASLCARLLDPAIAVAV